MAIEVMTSDAAAKQKEGQWRVKFTDHNGIWWTQSIDSWVDVCTLVRDQRAAGLGTDVFENHRPRHREIVQMIEHAKAVGVVVMEIEWGNPKASGVAVRVPAGWPPPKLTKDEPQCCGAGEPTTIALKIVGEPGDHELPPAQQFYREQAAADFARGDAEAAERPLRALAAFAVIAARIAADLAYPASAFWRTVVWLIEPVIERPISGGTHE